MKFFIQLFISGFVLSILTAIILRNYNKWRDEEDQGKSAHYFKNRFLTLLAGAVFSFFLVFIGMIIFKNDTSFDFNFFSSEDTKGDSSIYIINEDFEDKNNHWETSGNSKAKTFADIADGYFYFSSKNKNPYSRINKLLDDAGITDANDFEIEIRLKLEQSDHHDSYCGVEWGNDFNGFNFNAFNISRNQKFSLHSYQDGTIINTIKNWTHSASINTKDFNKINIKKLKDTYLFFINNNKVYSTRGLKLYGGYMGFNVSGYSQLLVDYIRIRKIN